ncbi:alpha/beta fold hydrolase [Erythrobacter colymbi]|uniref:alpha/beta fold hydrolase n=1 Tax=Erythrobacter colymbi TaxID=1161202 RepID=UPI000A3A7822|nr:alpha/beta fold hydrolase [Erythrobacter colymbi]
MVRFHRFWAGLALVAALPFASIAADAQEPAPAATPATAAASPAEPPPPPIAVGHFAKRPAFWDAKLSPNGAMFSFMRHSNGEVQFVITDTTSGKLVRALAADPQDELDWYRWVTNDKLLLAVSTPGEFFREEVRYTRLILVEVSSGVMTRLFARSDVVEGDNVIHVAKDGSYVLVAIQQTIYDYPSVLRHELKPGGKISVVQDPRDGVWNWVADDQGVVRMGTGWFEDRFKVYYRPGAGENLKLVARLKESDTVDRYWDALSIVNGSDEGYVLSEGDTGRVGLRRVNFSTREVIETVYEHPEWDIDSVTLKDGKPFAAYYTAERDEVHWFDPAIAKQYRSLRKALGDGEVWVTSRAEDETRMLVYAGHESDPGVLYLYDPAAKRLQEISQFRPEIDFRALASPKPVQYTARDGTVIRGYLTLPRGREAKNLPLILMPHGGPYGVRDKLEYNDEVQLLANRGYAVLQPNYRGSGGYGDAFFEAGAGQIGRKMQDDIDDAMDWAVKQGIADAKRVCVVGGSYGGYAALWAVLRNPERYRCAASWAGVTDWNKLLRYDRRYLTARVNKWWQARVRGDKTQDLDGVSPYRTAGTLSRPVLLAHGTKDKRVPISQYNIFEKAARIAPVPPQTLVIKDEGHSFSSPENAQAWYEALDGFLAKHNPADPAPATAAAPPDKAPAAAQ